MKRRNYSHGFSIIEVVIVLVILGVVGFVGWYIWHGRQSTATTKPVISQTVANSNKTANKPVTVVSTGYVRYENKSAGFRFTYPKEYGAFKPVTATDATTEVSDKPNPAYIAGSGDAITVRILKDSSSIFSTFKYGPSVKFVAGKLIVQEVNPADERNVVGQEYKGFFDRTDVTKQVNDLKVYDLTGGDEGTTYYQYVFQANGQVVSIRLPGFYDGTTMMCPDSGCVANDKAAFEKFAATVLASISKI